MGDQDHQRRGVGAELARALAWPVFAVIALVALGGPLRTLLVRAGEVVAVSSRVSVGSFSLEVQRAAVSAGDPELGNLIRGLSSTAIRILLATGDSAVQLLSTSNTGEYLTPSPDERAALDQLQSAGLLKYTVAVPEFEKSVSLLLKKTGSHGYVPVRSLSDGEKKALERQAYELTERGRKSWSLIVDAVGRQARADRP